MKTLVVSLCVAAAGLSQALAQEPAKPAPSPVPRFQVDPTWPKPLPNNWSLGQVSGIAVDRFDHIWLVHRPSSLTLRERVAEQIPFEAKCCVAALLVLAFDQSGNLIRSWGGLGQGV